MKQWTGSMMFGCVMAGSLLLSNGANAQINDPVGDFLPSYTGAKNGDMDVVFANVQYDANNNLFLFDTKMNGAIGTTANSLYVLGFDRGAGTARFGALASGVTFDSVLTVSGTGVGAVRDLVSNAATNLPGSAVQIIGNEIKVQVPASLLVSKGLAVDAYTWNLWPRLSAGGGTQPISDFAPDNSNLRVQAVPEPGTLALVLGLGLGALPLSLRRRK